MNTPRTFNIIIAALGGEGGGVLTQWILKAAQHEGYLTQATSIPGVAQRTGATIYYIELFQNTNEESLPIMSLVPIPGDIDLIIASEIVEAGRMVQRGFSSAERTTIITSSHRSYSIVEKIDPNNGMVDDAKIHTLVKSHSRQFFHANMQELANTHSTNINAVLLGALVATNVFTLSRNTCEHVLKKGEKANKNNLFAFESGFNVIQSVISKTKKTDIDSFSENQSHSPSIEEPLPQTTAGKLLVQRIKNEFHPKHHPFMYSGIQRLANYQDREYATEYLDHLTKIHSHINKPDSALLYECARYLALWMAYEDIIRVAEIKISSKRHQEVYQEINIDNHLPRYIYDYFKPQFYEYISLLPVNTAHWIQSSPMLTKLINTMSQARQISSNKPGGFILLYLLSRLKPLRRKSWGFKKEHEHINYWLSIIFLLLKNKNDLLAFEVIKSAQWVKGYGETRQQGIKRLSVLLKAIQSGEINNQQQFKDFEKNSQ